ncbi:MAG: hypothetical protein ABIU05_15605, partial [Nitrospirales bacterium]
CPPACVVDSSDRLNAILTPRPWPAIATVLLQILSARCATGLGRPAECGGATAYRIGRGCAFPSCTMMRISSMTLPHLAQVQAVIAKAPLSSSTVQPVPPMTVS